MAEPAYKVPVTQPEGDPQRTSWRSVILAGAITLGMNAVVPYTHHAMHTVSLVEGMIPLAVLMPFLLLVFVVNPILKAVGHGLVLGPCELVTIFAVGYVSGHINEFLGRVIATFAVMHYMATPENLWADYAFGLVKPWLVVGDAGDRLAWFYEGLPRGASVPWSIWLSPLFWWLAFVIAIGVGCLTFAAIIRHQWVEQERLPFPFARATEELAETGRPEGFPAYMRGALFWTGFAIPAFIVLWYVVGYFRPGMPVIGFGIRNYVIHINRYVPAYFARINFLIVAFAYFTDLQVLSSIWIFYVLTWLQIGITTRLGVAKALGQFAGASQQALGGFIVFSLWGLWIARRHLAGVFRQAFLGVRYRDDSREMFSYRAATLGFLCATAFMVFWLVKGGMSAPLAVLVVVFWFVFYAGFAKVIAMTGLVFAESPALGLSALGLVPPESLSSGTIAMRQLVGSTYQNGKCFAMPSATHAARLAEPLGGRARTIGRAALVTFVLALVVAALSTIFTGYQDGAFNFGSYMFRVAAPRYYDGIVSAIRDIGQETHYGLRMAYTGFGAAVVAILTFCSYRYTWWPLHPIGFFSVIGWSSRTAIMSVFLVWLVKLILFRVGGISLYRRGTPFFIGMIVGYTLSLIVSLTVDLIWFPGHGHNLYWGD